MDDLFFIDESKNLKFVIEYGGEGVGFYLYIYNLASGGCVKDTLQDTLSLAKEDACEFYGKDITNWKKASINK